MNLLPSATQLAAGGIGRSDKARRFAGVLRATTSLTPGLGVASACLVLGLAAPVLADGGAGGRGSSTLSAGGSAGTTNSTTAGGTGGVGTISAGTGGGGGGGGAGSTGADGGVGTDVGDGAAAGALVERLPELPARMAATCPRRVAAVAVAVAAPTGRS